MQVKQRLWFNTALVAVSVIALIAVLIVTAQRVGRVMEQKQIADALITASFERLALRTDYMRTSSERAREQVRAKNEQVHELLKSASEKFTDTGDKQMISALIEGHESIGKIFRAIVANRQNTGPEGRNAALSGEIEDRLLSQLNMRAYEAVSISSKLQDSSNAALVSSLRFGGGWIAFVLLLIGAATLINSLLLNRTIAARIDGLYDGASALGRGNLEHRIDLPGDDEFTSLASSFNEMAKKLSGSYRELEKELLERKRAEEELHRAAEFRAAAMDRLGEGLYTIDDKGLVSYMNSAAEELFGWSFAELCGKRMHDMTHHHYRDGRPFPIEECVGFQVKTTGQPLKNFEDVFIRKDGTFFDVVYSIAPMRDGAGKINGLVVVFSDITERKKSEDELRRIQERLESHMTNSPLAIIEFDHSYRVVRWSGDAERIFGWKAEEVVGKPISGIRWVYEEDIPSVVQVSEDMSTGRRPRNLNVNRNYRKDGSIIHCEWYNSAIYDEQGRMTSVLSQVLDISERKRAEEAVRESEEQFRTLADSIPNLAWWANGDGYITWYNRRWYDYTGTTHEQMEGWGWQSVHDPTVLPVVLERWKASLATGEPFDMEFPLRGADGLFRPFLTRVLPLKDSAGRVIRWFGTNTDVSERKRAEEALKESERRYHSLFENMTEGFAFCKMLFDNDDRPVDFVYLDVNSSFRKITGLENVVGKKVTEVIPGIKESHPELFDIYGRVALTGQPERFQIEFKPLGMWLSISVYSIEKGYFVAVFDDITKRKKAEVEILKLSEDMAARNVELEGVNRELEAFIYSISHDLRAPVRTMAGFARFLAEDYEDKLDDQAKDYLRRINLGSEKMTLLINDLLRLSKISRQEFDRMDIDLSKLASSVISGLRASDPGRSVEVLIAEGLTAFADPRLMEIVLSNLLGNSWKFTSKTEKAQIEFGARRAEGDTTYFIRDNGAGFNPQYMEKMFWPFQRLHTEEEFEGTGIGLAIVERIIRRHSGKVWAEGEVGKGATVNFTLGQNRV